MSTVKIKIKAKSDDSSEECILQAELKFAKHETPMQIKRTTKSIEDGLVDILRKEGFGYSSIQMVK